MRELTQKKLFRSPWFVMALAGLMYVLKWLTKVGIGEWVNSPALIADGYHNLADLFEVGLVMFFGIYIGSRPRSEKYPMGLKRVESILALLIGAALILLASDTLAKSISGLVALWPKLDGAVRPILPAWILPPVKDQLISKEAFLGVSLTVGASALISAMIGRYEIRIGKKFGMASMTADGKETLSDGRIELASFIGFTCKFVLIFAFGKTFPKAAPVIASCIEYGLGIMVAIIVSQTVVEILDNALGVLVVRSIGEDKTGAIRDLVLRVEGVRSVDKLITFCDGHTASCIAAVTTNASGKAHRPLLRTLTQRIGDYLAGFEDYVGQEVFVEFVRPKMGFIREANAIIKDDKRNEMNAPAIAAATHIRIYDMDDEGGRHRGVDVPLAGMALDDIVAKLLDKGVRSISVFVGDETERRAMETAGISYKLSATLRVYIPTRVRG